MAKIRIFSSLKTNEGVTNNEFLGIYQNNKIVYKENNINVTIFIFDNKIRLNRVANDYNIMMEFIKNKTTSGIYQVNSHNIEMDLKIKTNELEINKNNFKIEYELRLNNEDIGIFRYVVEYEVI